MPYKLEKDPQGGGYFVVSESGKRHSDAPLSRKEAVKQMRALYANFPDASKEIGSFLVFKDTSGNYRWVSYSSNAYRDLDGEIVSEKALTEDVDRADLDRDFGPLRYWHMKGVDLGDCDFNMMQGRILVESGTFRDPVVAERVKESAPNLQVSIGFKHPLSEPDSDGVYHTIKRFERSILPAGKAANPLTRFFVEGVNMATQKEKEEALGTLLKDPTLADFILSQAGEVQKEATASGVAYKEVDATQGKAKKKKPAEDPADVEGDPAEEADETQEEEDSETTPGKKLPFGGMKAKPFGKKEFVEEEAEEEKHADDDESFAIGDVPIEEFYDTLAEVLGNVFAPISKEMATIKEAMETRTKASNDAVIAQEARIRTLEVQLSKAAAQLKELRAESPAVVRGYSATEDSRTVVSDEAAKEKMPPQGVGGNGNVMDFISSFALGGMAK